MHLGLSIRSRGQVGKMGPGQDEMWWRRHASTLESPKLLLLMLLGGRQSVWLFVLNISFYLNENVYIHTLEQKCAGID